MALSREIILTTALELVDREGLGQLSMRRLGAALGVEAMSLYRYVANKNDLYDGILETVVAEVELGQPTGEWVEDVVRAGTAMYDTLSGHPRALPLLASRPAVTPSALRVLESALALLAQDGASTSEALAWFEALFGYVVGFAVTQLDHADPDTAVAYGALDPDSHPHLRSIPAALMQRDARATFVVGLRAMARGFAAIDAAEVG